MNSSISMLLHVSKLHKCIIFLAYTQLTVNKVKNDKFIKLYETIFHKKMSTAHAEHMSYIIVIYIYIYILISSSINFSNLYIVEIANAYTQHILTYLLFFSTFKSISNCKLISSYKLISSCKLNKMIKLLQKKKADKQHK